jgi:hypothetical protein
MLGTKVSFELGTARAEYLRDTVWAHGQVVDHALDLGLPFGKCFQLPAVLATVYSAVQGDNTLLTRHCDKGSVEATRGQQGFHNLLYDTGIGHGRIAVVVRIAPRGQSIALMPVSGAKGLR